MVTTTPEKIIIALVEGPNDEVGLTQLLRYWVKQRYNDREVKLAVVGTDLLQHERPAGPLGMLELVYGQVESFLSKNKLDWENLVEVIEICDVDGVYLNDGLLQNQLGSIEYREHSIFCADTDYIKNRNARKRANIDELLAHHELQKGNHHLPFSLYYFSCNFEHVFFNSRNNTRQTKRHLALQLDEEFSQNPSHFFEIHFTEDVFPFSTYQESWDALRKETTRIPRCSNLNVWLPSVTAPLIH
jgi:hypothetical protein